MGVGRSTGVWAVGLVVGVMAVSSMATAESPPHNGGQLASVPMRFEHWDNPAFYALLKLPWPVFNEKSSPIDVPWDALLSSDSDWHRGNPYTLHGRFLASETIRPSRPSVIDGELVQRWVIQWGEGDDDVAVVVLPAVEGGFGLPLIETDQERFIGRDRRVPLRFARVAIPARFLGFWSTNDREGRPFDFPVFVAADAAVYDTAEHASGASGQAAMLAGIAVLMGIGAVVWWRVRRRGWESRNHRRRREALNDQVELDEETGDDLADNPAEALGRLTDRD
ncbi:MAG: hypothetical protein AAFY08_13640 [Planctomycetota bacterium]